MVFNAESFVNKVQKSTKILESSDPEIVALSTKDKFNINKAAGKLMRVKPEDRIVMMDMNLDLEEGQEPYPIENRFYLAIDETDTPVAKGKLSNNLEFSYVGTWAAIMLNEDAANVSHDTLVKREKAIARKSGKYTNYIANQKVKFDLIRFTQEDEDGNIVDEFPVLNPDEPQAVYAMVNPRVIEHTPEINKGRGRKNNEEYVEEEIED